MTENIRRLVREERHHLAELILHLIEFDRRRLYAEQGYRSLYLYCVEVLGYSEQGAYKRINAARVASRFPAALSLLRLGRLHMAALVMLSPHLTKENHAQLLIKACGKSKRELELLVAPFEPGRKIPDRIFHFGIQKPAAEAGPPALPLDAQVVPTADPASTQAAASSSPIPPCPEAVPPGASPAVPPPSPDAAPPPVPPPPGSPAPALMPEAIPSLPPAEFPEPQVRISFSASEHFFRKLEKVRGLLRHKHPSGRLEEVFDETMDLWLDRKDPDRRLAARRRRREKLAADSSERSPDAPGKPGAAAPPESAVAGTGSAVRLEKPDEPVQDSQGRRAQDRSRRIPQPVKDAVWERDHGRCTYIAPDGLRCKERVELEFDHIQPWALGGRSDDAANIRLLCRTHNHHRGWKTFGRDGPRDPSAT